VVFLSIQELRQKHGEFEASLGYIGRPCLKINGGGRRNEGRERREREREEGKRKKLQQIQI
jgi:hypothetical protein